MAIKTHLININGVKSSIQLSDVYDTTDSNIGSVIGIERISSDSDVPDNTRPIELGSALRNGLVIQLNIRYSSTTAGGKAKYGKIICPIDKAYIGVTKLEGKTYRGGTVSNVSVPQNVRYK